MERKVESERMLVSHRLTNTLVDFANIIIDKRSELLGKTGTNASGKRS